MGKLGKSFSTKGTLKEQWLSAIKDPVYWLTWLIIGIISYITFR